MAANNLFIAMLAVFAVAAIAVIAWALMRSRKARSVENGTFLVGRWRVSEYGGFMEFGKGYAGYCEADGEIETFSFVVRGDRLRIEQNCVVRRYRMIRGGDGVLRLEGKSGTLVLKRQSLPQKQP